MEPTLSGTQQLLNGIDCDLIVKADLCMFVCKNSDNLRYHKEESIKNEGENK